MKFTDNLIKGLKPKNKPYRLYEKGADKGFGIQVTPSGSKSFFLQYALNGKRKFLNLGRYPSIGLSEARDNARINREQLLQGSHTSLTPEVLHGSLENLISNYIEQMRQQGKRSWEKVQADIEYNVFTMIDKNTPAKDIEPPHIRKVLHAIIQRGATVQANRVRSYLHRAFELGIFHDNDPKSLSDDYVFNIAANPVSAVPKNAAAEKVGERTLSFEEIAVVWHPENINIPTPTLLAIKLLLIYGLRPIELTGAKKSEFDFKSQVWSIPPERIKNKRWHLLPIVPLAQKLLEELMLFSGNSNFLMPGRYNPEVSINKTSLGHTLAQIQKNSPHFPVFTPRDLRRTVKTRMGEIGIHKSIRDIIQNHAMNDVSSKHYDRWDYLPEKREALEKWCYHLENHLPK
ncbi:tyrosine-type recombinase/integrase [Methylotuvimicrobium sp.]|uniref:tyrosine-type recombinase/integrase n=1 Tax=Methylotuvimicrobium sp. TaxID=2822413 RepID=UPI003D654746